MAKQDQHPPTFVIAATLAGHLYRMMRTAKLMSLSASNAKGVAARGGDKVLGFRPITDYIAEMANDTIYCATKISQLALDVSRISVTSLRTQDGIRRFVEAREQLSDSKQTGVIDKLIHDAADARTRMQAESGEIMSALAQQLDEIHQRVRSSIIIVSNSRTEASRAGEFQTYLDSIADSVERAVRDIQHEIGACRRLIEILETFAGGDRGGDEYAPRTGTS